MYARAYKFGCFLSQELSAEIGDCLSRGWLDKSQQCVILIKYWSNLLARSIKTAHKKVDLFLSRLFAVFEIGQYFINIWKTTYLYKAFRISSIMLNMVFILLIFSLLLIVCKLYINYILLWLHKYQEKLFLWV